MRVAPDSGRTWCGRPAASSAADIRSVQDRCLSRDGVGREHQDGPLVPALHAEQRTLGIPSRGRQVLVCAAVPGDLGPAPVKPQHVQGDVRVGGPRGRVPDRARRPLRVNGVGDPPTPDGRIVDPGGQQLLAVRSPPVAAETAHGLGCDMLREAVGNVVVLRGGQQAARSIRHRHVTGSSPPWVRRNSTRPPSRETVTARGTPSVKRLVLASCLGKSSIATPALCDATAGYWNGSARKYGPMLPVAA